MKTQQVSHIFKEDKEQNSQHALWASQMDALADFIIDYEYLKNLHGLSQEDIAKTVGTTQSAISRLMKMRGKPSYDLLRRVSQAARGELYITPLKEYSITLPYDLHEIAQESAHKEGLKVHELLKKVLSDYFKAQLVEEKGEM
jgi:transcriptional regulator with XRE-family HTH domain